MLPKAIEVESINCDLFKLCPPLEIDDVIPTNPPTYPTKNNMKFFL